MSKKPLIEKSISRAYSAVAHAQRVPARFYHAGVMSWLDKCENVIAASEAHENAVLRLVDTTVDCGAYSFQFNLAVGNWAESWDILDAATQAETEAFKAHSERFYMVFPSYP